VAKIKTVASSDTFNALFAEARAAGERNDCAVKAIVLATGVSYEVARAALAVRGRKTGHGAWPSDINAVIRSFGFRLDFVMQSEFIRAYPLPHRHVASCVTTHHPRRFAKVWPKGTFLIYTRGHVLTCIDGVVHDWTINKAKRVTEIFRVVKE